MHIYKVKVQIGNRGVGEESFLCIKFNEWNVVTIKYIYIKELRLTPAWIQPQNVIYPSEHLIKLP